MSGSTKVNQSGTTANQAPSASIHDLIQSVLPNFDVYKYVNRYERPSSALTNVSLSSSGEKLQISNSVLSGRKMKPVHRACIQCKKLHSKCAHERPCPKCVARGIADSCVDSPRRSKDQKVKQIIEENKPLEGQNHNGARSTHSMVDLYQLNLANYFTHNLANQNTIQYSNGITDAPVESLLDGFYNFDSPEGFWKHE